MSKRDNTPAVLEDLSTEDQKQIVGGTWGHTSLRMVEPVTFHLSPFPSTGGSVRESEADSAEEALRKNILGNGKSYNVWDKDDWFFPPW